MKLIYLAIAISAVALAYADDASDSERNARILAAYSTRTVLSLTTTTVTSIYQCLSKISTTACLGRKKRRYHALMDKSEMDDGLREDRGLEGSINEENLADYNDSGLNGDYSPAEKEGRIALTVWSTTTSSYTMTSTSTNTATTLSLSFWCSIYGMSYPATCA
ncbi:unnamed protein product [Meganyctiphanes norvegica]|uniref:Uncharacterized protein n=1 Tax=Meganyctiphanes norvegica TaxID=48144 RepID=A0AAV2PM74_MEGNR